MFLSYAQRLEDYHLLLAFAGEGPGTYVDVGAGHPVADNVTFALYLAGWSGLVVEPQARLLDLYAHVRPRDRRCGDLVGRAEGEAAFHVFDTFHGLSTMVPETAARAREHAAPPRVERRAVTTLAALAAAHDLTRIDVLKIDVEGAEGDVLAGADWSRLRPRLILAEVVSPGRDGTAAPEWENELLARGYRFRLFDGLNRFYVAAEEEALAARLPATPAPWDAVHHLYAFGRAPENADHPDHALARQLVAAFLARLPEWPAETIRSLAGEQGAAIDWTSDAARAALARIAAPYDGGLILDP